MSVAAFADQLYQLPLSEYLRATMWVVPTSQSLHILAIAALVASVLMTDLRLAGVLATDVPRSRIAKHYLPWFWSAFAVLIGTGFVQVLAEPTRELNNSLFWIKMVMIVFAVMATLILRYPAAKSGGEDSQRSSIIVKLLAIVTILLWVGIIIAGRWIAYWI